MMTVISLFTGRKYSISWGFHLPAMQETNQGLIPGSARSPGVGNGNPLQYAYLENSTDRGAWWATVHGVTLTWRIPWTGEPGGLQSMGHKGSDTTEPLTLLLHFSEEIEGGRVKMYHYPPQEGKDNYINL